MLQHASQDGADVIMHAPLPHNNKNVDDMIVNSSRSSHSNGSRFDSNIPSSSSSGVGNTGMEHQNVSYRISNTFFNNNNNNSNQNNNSNRRASNYNNASTANVTNSQTVIHDDNDAGVEMNFMQQAGVHKISGYNLHEHQQQQSPQP